MCGFTTVLCFCRSKNNWLCAIDVGHLKLNRSMGELYFESLLTSLFPYVFWLVNSVDIGYVGSFSCFYYA